MPDYKAMYFHLAAKVADAVDLLTAAQQQGEASYLEGNRPLLLPMKKEEDEQ